MSEASTRTPDGGSETQMRVGETVDGEPYTLPVEEVLTGRGFVTGKSGAGKSNTGSVVAEELLERGHPLLIVDTDGEYWGLKEAYEILHVGATEECDLQVGPEHARKLAELALERHTPIVLDVSGYVDGDIANELVRETARELFAREQEAMQPFLLLVEEIHEYVPQQGAPGDVGEMLIRIAKRGRKRGLGIAGFSQRPANVAKDFITQADWLTWHRLTWENDVDVVKRVVGAEAAGTIDDLGDGEAFVQADWDEADVERVQFRRKRTFDAGATPGLDDVERPELQSIDETLVGELEEISERQQRRQDRVEELEAELEAKDEEIEALEAEIDRLKTADETLDLLTQRLQGGEADDVDRVHRDALEEKNEEIAELETRVENLQASREQIIDERDELQEEVERLRGIEERVEQAERIEEQLDRAREVLGVDVQEAAPADDALRAELQEARERIAELEDELEQARGDGAAAPDDLAGLVQHDAVQAAVTTAKDNADRGADHFDRVLGVLASAEDGGPLGVGEIEPLTEVSDTTVREVLKELHRAGVVRRDQEGRKKLYALDRDFLERRIEVAEQQP